jgi:hypothetical protein
MPSASRRLLISSPRTSIVAIFPCAFSSLTTRTTSGMAVPAMYRFEILRTMPFGTTGRTRTMARSAKAKARRF